jgi:drug/metabolite transporter (DMT)-like permease
MGNLEPKDVSILTQILIVLFIGILIFNESITINKIIGILFGILSIYLLLS